jgi:GNAT superfamily N-acetyltransferase
VSPADDVVLADHGDAQVLSGLIALAFHSLAPSVWLIPDARQRSEILPRYFYLLVDDALTRGRVYTTTGRTAAALWFPAGQAADADPDGYDEALKAMTGRWVDRFRMFDACLRQHHPTGIRHEHLAILAVHPDRQRRGLGTALLAARHAVLDRTAPPTAAYLEASGPDTRAMYLRHGYRDLEGGPIGLPQGPSMYPMLRPAPTTAGTGPLEARSS